MTDPFDLSADLPGGLLRADDRRGSRPARLRVTPERITAVLEDGEEVHLSLEGVRLREAPDGDGLYCTSKDRTLTVHSFDPDFLRALEAAGGNDLNDALSRLAGDRVTSKMRHRLGCVILFALTSLMVWGVPRLVRTAVDASIEKLPYEIDEQIGEVVFESMDKGGTVVDSEVLREAVQAMVDRLAPHSLIPDATFQFVIVDNEQINAFALPGGYMVVFTGLIAEADGPEEVAGVIAHEMAHVTRRHGLRRIAHTVTTVAGISVLVGDVSGLATIALELFTIARANDYSQGQETDADLEGARMLIAAQIDPSGLERFFQRVEEIMGEIPDSLTWLSTHPQHQERIDSVRNYVAEHGAGVEWIPLDIDWEAVRAELE